MSTPAEISALEDAIDAKLAASTYDQALLDDCTRLHLKLILAGDISKLNWSLRYQVNQLEAMIETIKKRVQANAGGAIGVKTTRLEYTNKTGEIT